MDTPKISEKTIEKALSLVEKVYADCLRPPATEVGRVLKDIFRALRLVAFPFQVLAFLQSKIDIFIEETLKQVKEENRVLPPAQVILKVYQDLGLYHQHTITVRLLSNLMACFMDKNRLPEAHPAFLLIIPQLCEDEIKILSHLNNKRCKVIEYIPFDNVSRLFSKGIIKESELPMETLVFPERFFMYISHIHSLNLAGYWQEGNQLADMQNNIQIGVTRTGRCRLTEFGELFVKTCITNINFQTS
jgi:hypothetical protein